MTRRRSTSETLRLVLESFAMDLHVAIPGIVRAYDAATQTATVEPGVQRVLSAADEDADEDAPESLPILQGVPVAWPRAGGHFVHWPMVAGDAVLLVFSEADINAWREAGGVVDPGVGTRHGLSGAVAIPGMFTLGDPNPSADGSNGRVGREGGPFVEFKASTIDVGGAVALAEEPDLEQHLAAIATALDAIAARITALDSGLALDGSYGGIARAILGGIYPIATEITRGT